MPKNEDTVFVVMIRSTDTLPYIHRIYYEEDRANDEVRAILGQVRNEHFTVWVNPQQVY